jgi:von Willebrand factor type A domain/Aerotolerance regulator N-terminal
VPFTTPLALLGLLFVPAVIAMYLLRLRRDEAVVPSTLLWTRLVADIEANAPWQKLRRSLLLLLQLLLVIALALLAARPFLERPAGLARDIVLVMDTSASMAATDVVPDRLTAAKQVAIEALKDLPTGGKVSVIAADRSARIVVNESRDLSRVRQAIEGIPVTQSRGDLGDALELASKLAARSGDAHVLVATDAALARTPVGRVAAPVKVLAVGRERKNQAIVALAIRTAPSTVTRSVFVSVANLDLVEAARRLEVWGDDRLLEVRDVRLDAQRRSDVIIDDLPREVRTVEVRLVGADPAVTAAPDQLTVDDRAWAVVPPDRTRLVLIVGDGDPYLETALSYLPDVELFGVTPAEYGPKTDRTDGRPWDLIVFEGFVPTTLPKTPILAIAPPRSSALGDVSGTLKDPGIGTLDPDEPVLRFVDLSTTHISAATKLAAPAWARTIIPGPRGAPLLYAGTRDGINQAVLAFEPRRSDLPLQVAFPILLANLTGELFGSSTAPTEAVEPGTPVQLVIPSGARGLTVTRPDATVTELVPSTTAGESGAAVTFADTDLLGVYTVAPIADTTASPGPSAGSSSGPSGGPSASPAPTARPIASAGSSGQPIAVDPLAPVRFAVDLFDVDESTIAPGNPSTIAALGTGPGASPAPGASGQGGSGAGATERPTTRDELWAPIVLAILAFLCIEWALYHRDGLVKLRRAMGERLGRARTGSVSR